MKGAKEGPKRLKIDMSAGKEKTKESLKNDKRIRILSNLIVLFLSISAVIHISQLAIFGIGLSVIIVAFFGVVYAILAVLHYRKWTYSPHFSILFPAIGASLGIYRFVTIMANPYTVADVALDLFFIIPLSAYLLRSGGYMGKQMGTSL